ncbi:MAG: argininosuccinate synthase [Dehalococcoidales bacterium]|nr:argininosuccinate synthase [Dehalococcoidales bacterium]
MRQRVVLAYSGGLDTSVCIRWLQDKYDAEVITVTMDLGANERDLEQIQAKALRLGAKKALVIDARDLFVKYFIYPALQAGAIYEGAYPLATALGRPLIAKLLVDTARQEGATAVAHGSTGKGNDQVRFDVAVAALAPDINVIAPVREWQMSREEEIEYAREHDIPVPVTHASPYSIDVNLWGRSIECGVLEDPWNEPPEEVYEWTVSPRKAPDEPFYVEIGFERGVPVSLDGEGMDGVVLIEKLNKLGGAHGIGRVDHVENRLVGIKSREIYEAPAATILHAAHAALETLTLTKDSARFKSIVAIQYADLIYNGLWFSALHQDLAAYVASSQRHVTGVVRVRLQKGNCQAIGRQSAESLYSYSLATYDRADAFDHRAAEGFIKLFGLPLRTQAQIQLLGQAEGALGIMPPKVDDADIRVEEAE